MDREPAGPWAPPQDAWELELRLRAALAEVGELEGVRFEPAPPSRYHGAPDELLPTVLNVGRRIPGAVWERACHLAVYGRPDPPS